MRRLTLWVCGGVCALGLALAIHHFAKPAVSHAADHNDPPTRAGADPDADIGDFYAWHKDDGNMVVVVTFEGNRDPGAEFEYDGDVIYGVHFSNVGSGGDPMYDVTHETFVRFGQDSTDAWGIQVMDMPGEDEAIEGAVETELDGASGNSMAWVGECDDPFFFDLEGFVDTVMSGDLSFESLNPEGDGARDTLMGQNATCIVLEFPAAEVTSEGGMVHTWATTGRIE